MPRPAALFALLAPFVLCAALGASRADAAWVGDPAPEFELPSAVSTGTVALSSLKGKVVFVHFWASWCTPCEEELPKLNELASSYAPDGFALLALTVDSSKAKMQKFLDKHLPGPLHLRVLQDPGGKTATAYRNRAMPVTYVVDRGGVIRFVHMGYIEGDEAKWRAEIERLRAEKDPRQRP